MQSAELLLAANMFADAVSRAYYGAFHYARALLLMLGEEPVTHAGVERLLHRDVVRAGILSADVARQFARLQKMRLDADYTSEFVFTAIGANGVPAGLSARRACSPVRPPGGADWPTPSWPAGGRDGEIPP